MGGDRVLALHHLSVEAHLFVNQAFANQASDRVWVLRLRRQ